MSATTLTPATTASSPLLTGNLDRPRSAPTPGQRTRRASLRPGIRGRSSAGFTLVELLLVVVILGILAAIVVPQFSEVSLETKEAALVANLNTVRQAISLYRIHHDEVYPGQASWAELLTQLSSSTAADGSVGGSFGPYLMTSFPDNPLAMNNDGKLVVDMSAGPSGSEGYAYHPATGELRANLPGNALDGTPYWDL